MRIQPPVLAVPQPWAQQPISPYEERSRYDPDVLLHPERYAAPTPAWVGDLGIYPPTATPPSHTEPPADPTGDLSAIDHAKHGARSMILPGLVNGLVTGGLAAAVVPSAKGTIFAIGAVAGMASSITAGGLTGLVVGATEPTRSDSLATRYAIAGGVLGGLSGAIMPGGMGRPIAIMVGAGFNGIMGGIIGSSLAEKMDAKAAAA